MIYQDKKELFIASLPCMLCLLLTPSIACAYIGPGLGAGAIALIVIIVLSILLAVFSLVWYPLKAKMKKAQMEETDTTDHEDGASDTNP